MAQKLGSLKHLLIVQLTFWLREGVVSPIFALYIRGMGFSVTDIGILMLVRSLGWAIFEPTFGMLADRLGKKKLLIFSIGTTSFIYILYTFATSMTHFYLIAFAMSSFSAAGTVSSRAILAEFLPQSGRGKVYGRYMAGLSMGRMVGPFLGGFLADTISLTAPFYIAAGLGVVSIAAAISLRYAESSKAKIASQSISINMNSLLTKSFIGILILRMLWMFNMNFERNVLPIYLNENQNFKASETQIGIYMGVIQLTTGLSQLFLGDLTDRIGAKKMMFYGVSVGGLSYLSLFFLKGALFLYPLGAFQGIFFAAADLSLMMQLITTIPENSSGRAMGMYGLSEDVGGMIASLSLGIMYDSMGPNFSVLTVSTVLVIGAIISTVIIKEKKKDVVNS
jgi:MFS family permease